jgi:hypothetical protein
MLKQEAGRDKENVDGGAPKVIRHDRKQRTEGQEKMIAGIQEGGIPAILVWTDRFGPIPGACIPSPPKGVKSNS